MASGSKAMPLAATDLVAAEHKEDAPDLSETFKRREASIPTCQAACHARSAAPTTLSPVRKPLHLIGAPDECLGEFLLEVGDIARMWECPAAIQTACPAGCEEARRARPGRIRHADFVALRTRADPANRIEQKHRASGASDCKELATRHRRYTASRGNPGVGARHRSVHRQGKDHPAGRPRLANSLGGKPARDGDGLAGRRAVFDRTVVAEPEG